MHFASLRHERDDYTFRMDCPYCQSGTLLINVNPALKRDPACEHFWGIRAFQCEPECSCPLTGAEIMAIEEECERRAGLAALSVSGLVG